ncbi:MAG: zinc ABC transporter substrate-binding protein [Phycisphaeraceae bacterium]|nr:zinc ABC transporter substrate-binding protein [Phycisphaeraceae bacterium]
MHRASHVLMFTGVLLACLSLTACGGESPPPPQASPPGVINVAVSVLPHAWLVEQVGGPRVDVMALIEPGQSPHTYSPTDAQVSRVMASAVYFRTGLEFESAPWFDSLKSTSLKIVDLRRGIELLPMTEHDDHDEAAAESHDGHDRHGGLDPHIWLSPRLLKIQATTIAGTLASIDPPHAGEYLDNLKSLTARLDTLDKDLTAVLEPLKTSAASGGGGGGAFFVFHPAWGYFAHDYSLTQVPIEVQGKEPTDAELTALQTLALEKNVKMIFVQPEVAGRGAKAVADAIGAQLQTLDPQARDIAANLRHVAQALRAASNPTP